MKTLYTTYKYQIQARTRQMQLERKTGVKWDFYSVGDGIRFTAIITREISPDERVAQALLPHVRRHYETFDVLAERAELDLKATLQGVKALWQQRLVICGVNRMGNWASIKRDN